MVLLPTKQNKITGKKQLSIKISKDPTLVCLRPEILPSIHRTECQKNDKKMSKRNRQKQHEKKCYQKNNSKVSNCM